MSRPRNCTRASAVVASTIGLSFLCSRTALSCDTWVAMRDATSDGSVILAKNSDRPVMEAQPLVQHSRHRHDNGEEVQCTYIAIPQVGQTYQHIGSKIWWSFGYEHGLNEHGVAIGNEAVWSKEPYQWGDGLLGMDLLRLGLERGKTAYEAMHVMIDLLQRYGQCGDCEHEAEWGGANYHNSFLIADPHEAWVLETAGRYWAAKRITSGVYSISNIYTIEDDWSEAHPELVQHAIDKGWVKSAEHFNFARAYGDYWRKDSRDPGPMQIRRNATLSCLRRDEGRITPQTMMRVTRNHLEGSIVEPRWSPAEPFWAMPCLHDSPRSKYRSVASMVAHLRFEMPPLLRQVYWAGMSNPCCGVFQPFYLHGPTLPENYAFGTSKYSADSPWWQATRIKLLCDLNYGALHPRVRQLFDKTEQWEFDRQQQCEADADVLLHQDRQADAIAHIQTFVAENAVRIKEDHEQLNRTLPQILQEDGVSYLFTQYLADWSSRANVPLPIPHGTKHNDDEAAVDGR